jgi:hypothetical protein
MSLDLEKLEKLADLADGVKRARCPACAEAGGDRKGEHLRLYPDGRFGCCVHPGDHDHRKRIYALAGQRGRQGIRVKVAVSETKPPIQTGILGRLGRVFNSPLGPDATDGVTEVEMKTAQLEDSRTGRTGEQDWTGELFLTERTLRTPQYPLCTALKDKNNNIDVHKGFERPVRGVRGQKDTLPYLTSAGDLRIPFDSPERYHWWKPPFEQRLRVKQIIAELLAEGHQERKELDASPF